MALPRKQAPEYAQEMLVTGNPDAEVVGLWADGSTWAVPAMTEKEYEYQTQARAPQQVKHSLSWHGSHVKEGEVYIKKSTAKEKAWIIMWHHVPGEERPRQKMQIGVHGQPDKVQERVVEWMVALAQRFAADDMSKETLQSLKDDFTHELDGPTKKRPAAASKSEPKAKAKAAAKPVPKAEPKRSCAKAAPKLVPKAEPKIKPLAAPNRSTLPDLHLFGWDAGDYW